MPGTDVQPGFPLLRLIPATEDDRPSDIVEDAGRELRLSYSVESVDDDVVTLTEISSSRDDTPLRSDRGSLRFLGPEARRFHRRAR
ncbi:MAG: hypothetical protein QOF10_2341 [Kribbellaceae bacterium]|jgi:hypothetical protein|nr:hypothetical protein [Kribbellaceae bacterium]